MSGLRSRNKGKRGEKEFADWLVGLGIGMTARRGAQHKGGPDSPDVQVDQLPEVHFEVKRSERLRLYPSYEQAVEDTKEGQLPVLVCRRNRKPWLAVLLAEDLLYLLRDNPHWFDEETP